MENDTGGFEEMGNLIAHPILLVDGSASMKGKEISTGVPKHRAVAKMVQDLIALLYRDREVEDTLLTVICYDGKRVDDIRAEHYNVKKSELYIAEQPYSEEILDKWDPRIGHGGTTPIGRALAFAREKAEAWVMEAPSGVVHRAVICLLSDGMSYPNTEPNGVEERNKIVEFSNQQEEQRNQGTGYKGRIRIATVGYYQHPKGQNKEEDAGRALLQSLAWPKEAYFESDQAQKIAAFLLQTILDTGQEV